MDMVRRISCALIILGLTAVSGFSQIIGFPFPGGRFPGGNGGGNGGGSPFPGGGRRTRADQGPVQTLEGTLRRISSLELVLETDDRVQTTVALSNSTRYYLQPSDATSGSSRNSTAKRADFMAGDQISVEATQDDNSRYHATKVILVKTALQNDGSHPTKQTDSSSTRGGDSSDDDRPKLKRAGQPDAAAQPASSRDDSDQPTLKRGAPRPASSNADDTTQTTASSRPSIHANEVGGVTRLPDAPVVDDRDAGSSRRLDRDADPIIESAREAAFSFAETLPNYVVKQFTTRYGTQAAQGGKTSWQAIDTVTADVVSENSKESYKNVLVNGKPPKEAIEKTGAWSTGEYASLLQDVLSPLTDADFHGQRAITIVNRAAYRYDFSVQKANSHWHVFAESESYTPEYTGSIWIDKQNYRVLRIELAAQKMPKTFLLDTVESAVDYDYFLIGDGKFLLPAHSEALSCIRGTSDCTRNVIDFRNYRKFSAETSITFDTDK